MDEILLTEADVTEALREAYRTVYESSYEWNYACTDKTIATARVVARAQLRKVVEWLVATEDWHWRDALQALRAAAEEAK
jgi:hypothetical protein